MFLTCRCNRVPLLRTPPRREPQLRGTFGESVARKFGTSYLYRDRTGSRWRSGWPGCLASLGYKWIRLHIETHYKRSTCTFLIYKCIYLSMSTYRCWRVRIDTIDVEMYPILAAPTPPCIHSQLEIFFCKLSFIRSLTILIFPQIFTKIICREKIIILYEKNVVRQFVFIK